jgi:hypothetical protein
MYITIVTVLGLFKKPCSIRGQERYKKRTREFLPTKNFKEEKRKKLNTGIFYKN